MARTRPISASAVVDITLCGLYWRTKVFTERHHALVCRAVYCRRELSSRYAILKGRKMIKSQYLTQFFLLHQRTTTGIAYT